VERILINNCVDIDSICQNFYTASNLKCNDRPVTCSRWVTIAACIQLLALIRYFYCCCCR